MCRPADTLLNAAALDQDKENTTGHHDMHRSPTRGRVSETQYSASIETLLIDSKMLGKPDTSQNTGSHSSGKGDLQSVIRPGRKRSGT